MFKRNAVTVPFLISVALMVASSAVVAQVQPPVRELVDANGVDLLSGQMTSVYRGLSIGTDAAGLGFARSFRATDSWDSYIGVISSTGTLYSVSIGSTTETFTESGGVFTPVEPTGSTLALSGGTYTYTTRSGSVATFDPRPASYAYPSANRASLSTVTYPNGERLTSEYETQTICILWLGAPQGCGSWATAVRLRSVTSNFGLRLPIVYAQETYSLQADTARYVLPAQIAVKNLAQDVTVASVGIAISMAGGYRLVELTDALGRVTKYTIDPTQGISGIRRPGSSADNVTVTYVSGRVSSVNNDGVMTSYAYSDSQSEPFTRTTTITNAAGERVIISDITNGRVLSDRDELNRLTAYAYDAQGRLSRITAPEGNFVEFIRDARGNITQTLLRAKPGSALADIVTTADFDAACPNPKTCNQPNWTRDARGNQTDYTYDPTHGGVLTVTLPAPTAGAVRPQRRYSYTALEAWYLNSSGVLAASGQPIHLLTGTSTCRTFSSCFGSADESKTVIGYGATGVGNNRWPITVTSSDGTGALVSTVTSTYDLAGNMLTVDGPLAGAADATRTRYDALRRIVGMIGPDPEGARLPLATRHTYNTAGDLVALEKGTVNSQADGDWASFAALETVSLAYDAAGRRTQSSLIAAGSTHAVEQTSYDNVGRLLCAAVRMNAAAFGSLPASACTLGTTGSLGPDRITRRTYDAAGQVTAVTLGYGTTSPIDVTTSTYTTNGRRATVTDARGNLTTYEYDGFDRLNKTRFPSKTTAGSSSSTDYEERTYDENSNAISVRTRDGQVVGLGRDNLNRLVLKDLPGGAPPDVFLSYDNQNRLLTARFGSPTGAGVIDNYDGLGRLTSRESFGRTLSYLYDPAGRRTRVTHPDGFYAEYGYNAASELSTVTDSSGATLATFTYDALGRRSTLARGNTTSTGYTYDAVSRLQTLTQDLSGSSYDSTSTFAYSPARQIVSLTQSNDAAYTWTAANSTVSTSHNGLNQPTQIGSTAIGHDSLGNLETGVSTSAYGYDVENQLRSAVTASTTVSLSYDPLGLLREVTINGAGTKFLYDGADLVAEYNDAGTLLHRYVHGPGLDEPLVWYEGTGTTVRRYFHADERGSIVAISDNTGAGTVSLKYSPDGEAANAGVSRFGYTGQVWLAQPALCYYKSRMYSPNLGRFLQTDAIGYAGGMNLYAYVAGDPINRIDPYGFQEEPLEEVLVRGARWYDTFERDLFFLDLIEQERDGSTDGGGSGGSDGQQPQENQPDQAICTDGPVVVTTALNLGYGPVSAEFGNIFVVDWSAGTVHAYNYGGLGIGISIPTFSGAASFEMGGLSGANSRDELTGWGYAISGFAAVGPRGIAGQYFSNFSADYHGATGGYAIGGGGSLGFMPSYTRFDRSFAFAEAPEALQPLLSVCNAKGQ